jgi:hypothetical protein
MDPCSRAKSPFNQSLDFTQPSSKDEGLFIDVAKHDMPNVRLPDPQGIFDGTLEKLNHVFTLRDGE